MRCPTGFAFLREYLLTHHTPLCPPPASRTQVLRHHTRKTPNGEGSKTWDFYELRIHKRLIDLQTSSETLRQILNINIETGVQVDVTIHNG